MDRMRHTETGPDAGDSRATETLSPAMDDRMRVRVGAGSLGRRGAAFPVAVGALLLGATVALGALGVFPAGQRDQDPPKPTPPAAVLAEKTAAPSQAVARQKPDEATPKPTPQPAVVGTPATKPSPEATAKPSPKASAKPAPKPTPKPEAAVKATPKPTAKPAPQVGAFGLEAFRKADGVKLRWSAYEGAGFDYYKVVRSTNSGVGWPLGSGDALIAAIGDPAETWAWDGKPSPDTYWYRVFAVRSTESGYVVLAKSGAVKVTVPKPEPTVKPEPTPAPEPATLAFEATVTPDGVRLAWEACGGDGFRYYKVVRSATNPAPTWPLNDGSELIAVVEDPGAVSLLDPDVAPGQTWHYRVLAIGYAGDGAKLVLGITPVVTVPVE